jgi:hypothetical protein
MQRRNVAVGTNQSFAMMETCAQATFVLKQMVNVFSQMFQQLCAMIKTNALVILVIARLVNALILQRTVMTITNAQLIHAIMKPELARRIRLFAQMKTNVRLHSVLKENVSQIRSNAMTMICAQSTVAIFGTVNAYFHQLIVMTRIAARSIHV